MAVFILRRFLALLPLLLAISVLSFLLLSLSPGDYLTSLKANRDVSREFIDQLRAEYGLDLPLPQQYARWLGKAVRGDLGYSFSYKIGVAELIAQRIPATLLLAGCSLAMAWLIAVPLGVLAAVYRDSFWDRLSSGLAFFALSIPEMLLALLALQFASKTGWFPVGGMTRIDHEFLAAPERFADTLHHLVLPVFVLGIGSVASLMRIMRANFLDAIRADFVVTARAKGLPEGRVLFVHVLRNAINPLVTILGYAIAGLLSGALIVENIMSYPGLGQLTFEAILQKDIYVVMASILMASTFLVLGNLFSDLLLAAVDPRIRLQK